MQFVLENEFWSAFQFAEFIEFGPCPFEGKYQRRAEYLESSDTMIARITNLVKSFTKPRISKDISDRFLFIDEKGKDLIEASLRDNFFSRNDSWFDETYLSSEEGQKDLQDHLTRRLESIRTSVIPWLNDAKPLNAAHILEIGCGTGCSTVALAEQGAHVTAIDIHEGSLNAASDRCRVYGLVVDFRNVNAAEIYEKFSTQHFDFIIFYASLEHMKLDERMTAMKNTWNMLSPGGLWCVVDTPNRLWYFDRHTSWLPFYSWLPDDLAFLYSQYSPRRRFCSLYREVNDQLKLDFLRRGRGLSFHEFELTMKRAVDLDVVSCLSMFLRRQSILTRARWIMRVDRRHESILARVGPKIHRGFYQPSLDLIIRKD